MTIILGDWWKYVQRNLQNKESTHCMKNGTECVSFVTYDQVKNTKSKGQGALLVRNS